MNTINIKILEKALFTIAFTLLFISTISAGDDNLDWQRIINLSGKWKFSIGDDMNWAQSKYDDGDWEQIYVPSNWEDQGFHGYDGYAWYRKQFYFPKSLGSDRIYLRVGAIDDVDEIYINGNLIGSSGSFPPDYKSAYNAMRIYYVPMEYLNTNGKNLIAVRVYDSQLAGGIVWGEVGLFINRSFQPDISLEGPWKFKKGNSSDYKDKNYDDRNWDKINVPSLWETQGYRDYDGFAWYRFSVYIPDKYQGKQLVLVLGRIDDIDETYFNGKLIGSTGPMSNDQNRVDFDEAQRQRTWEKFRGYYIPKESIQYNQKNVIAVKVYDGYQGGGIYQGPVGIATQERYSKFWRDKKRREVVHRKNFFELLFGD